MRQKYKDEIAYLFKKVQIIKGNTKVPSWEVDGTPFYCDLVAKNSSLMSPISGAYSSTTSIIIKTTAQLDFIEGDRIAFTPNPSNDVDTNDFSLIQSVEWKPYLQKGDKHRNVKYYEYWISTT